MNKQEIENSISKRNPQAAFKLLKDELWIIQNARKSGFKVHKPQWMAETELATGIADTALAQLTHAVAPETNYDAATSNLLNRKAETLIAELKEKKKKRAAKVERQNAHREKIHIQRELKRMPLTHLPTDMTRPQFFAFASQMLDAERTGIPLPPDSYDENTKEVVRKKVKTAIEQSEKQHLVTRVIEVFNQQKLVRDASSHLAHLTPDTRVFSEKELKKQNETAREIGITAFLTVVSEGVSIGTGIAANQIDLMQPLQNISFPVLEAGALGAVGALWWYLGVPFANETMFLSEDKGYSMSIGYKSGEFLAKLLGKEKKVQEEWGKRGSRVGAGVPEGGYLSAHIAGVLYNPKTAAIFYLGANVAALGAAYCKTHVSEALRTKNPKALLPQWVRSLDESMERVAIAPEARSTLVVGKARTPILSSTESIVLRKPDQVPVPQKNGENMNTQILPAS
jgi:hypothetical protein